MEGDGERKVLLQDEYRKTYPKISPDGRWLAYQSNESGGWQIYVRPFPDVEKDKWMISTSGGHSPLWSPDGTELFYRNENATMAVMVENDPTFKAGKPKKLFEDNYQTMVGARQTVTNWDIHPDDGRFLMMKPSESTVTAPGKINIVINWFEELKETAPVD